MVVRIILYHRLLCNKKEYCLMSYRERSFKRRSQRKTCSYWWDCRIKEVTIISINGNKKKIRDSKFLNKSQSFHHQFLNPSQEIFRILLKKGNLRHQSLLTQYSRMRHDLTLRWILEIAIFWIKNNNPISNTVIESQLNLKLID